MIEIRDVYFKNHCDTLESVIKKIDNIRYTNIFSDKTSKDLTDIKLALDEMLSDFGLYITEHKLKEKKKRDNEFRLRKLGW